MKRRNVLLYISAIAFIASASRIVLQLAQEHAISTTLQSTKDGRKFRTTGSSSQHPRSSDPGDTNDLSAGADIAGQPAFPNSGPFESRLSAAAPRERRRESGATGGNAVQQRDVAKLKEEESHAKRGQYFPPNITYGNQPVNTHSYKLIINEPNLCDSPRGGRTNGASNRIYLLILMLSMPSDFSQRTLQRETCLSVSEVSGRRVKSLFLLGDPRDTSVMGAIRDESERYHDVLMEDFVDSYRNLTLKTIMGLKWASTFCNHGNHRASWVMKMDADVMFNIPVLVEYLGSLRGERLIAGTIRRNTRPFGKSSTGKWKGTRNEYRHKVYPDYPKGPWYVMSGGVVPVLYKESTRVPILPMEDVFVGILAARRNVTLVHRPPEERQFDHCTIRGAMVLHRPVTPKQFTDIWRWMMLPKVEGNCLSNAT